MLRSYIPIRKNNLPEQFEIDLADQSYLFGVNYNESHDMFSVDLYDINSNPIVLGEKLVLNETLWFDLIDERIPPIDLVPMDESGKATSVTFDNFMETVFLHINDTEEVRP